MKKLISLLLLLTALNAQAQLKPEKIEQYCELTITARTFSSKVLVTVDYGESEQVFEFKDKRIKEQLNKARNFTSVVGALNYMGSIGWKLIETYPIVEGSGAAEKGLHFFFKREFDRAELEEVVQKEPSEK